MNIIKAARFGIESVKWDYPKHQKTDYRRKLLSVKFNDGSFWYPRDIDIKILIELKILVHEYNIQYGDMDKCTTEKDLSGT